MIVTGRDRIQTDWQPALRERVARAVPGPSAPDLSRHGHARAGDRATDLRGGPGPRRRAGPTSPTPSGPSIHQVESTVHGARLGGPEHRARRVSSRPGATSDRLATAGASAAQHGHCAARRPRECPFHGGALHPGLDVAVGIRAAPVDAVAAVGWSIRHAQAADDVGSVSAAPAAADACCRPRPWARQPWQDPPHDGHRRPPSPCPRRSRPPAGREH